MTLLYASTFTKALGRLSAAEQKLVKITTVDLALDPTGNGLQLHRVEAAPGFWTARVSQDIRLVLHKDGERTLIAYVGHHDDAYRWAERRRLVPHERTGAMQFVEIIERTETVSRFVPVADAEAPAAPLPAHRPFATLTDDQLLDVGVPRDWLDAVRAVEQARADSLFARLPDEAAEALLDHATGGRLEDHVAVRAQPGSDPFVHPDAQRRFRMVEGLEELKAALDAPFAQWTVFLHPTQRTLVERNWTGPARTSGSAGTGKTIVALHRAVHLAKSPDARVLLTSFSEPLATALDGKVDLLAQPHPGLRERVTVRALDDAARELFTAAFGAPRLANGNDVRAAFAEAVKAGRSVEHSAEFLLSEWEEVVDAWLLNDAQDYASVPRLGRKTRLGTRQRESAWAVFAFVREYLKASGLVTWADIYGRLADHIGVGGSLPYTHIVVDEAQDLSVAQVRFLAAAGRSLPDALFLAGDLGQRIFHLPFSWAKLGLDIRGRSHVLKVCYRTSHQIRTFADRLLARSISDQDGNSESRVGTVSVFDGAEPLVRLFDTEADEIAAVTAWVRECIAHGIAADAMAILVRAPAQRARAEAVVQASGTDIPIMSMHDAKGLEFSAAALMALDEDVIPDPSRLENVGDMADLEAIQDTERHLLYVAATRARDRLLLSGLRPGSEFLDDLRPEDHR